MATKQGVHWSLYGGMLAADSIQSYIGKLKGKENEINHLNKSEITKSFQTMKKLLLSFAILFFLANFLSAQNDPQTRLEGLELGADDYVTKPYSKAELIARIRAVLRRQGDVSNAPDGVITAGPVRIDTERHQVNINNELISLPLKEFELLEFLVRNSGRVLTRSQLIDRVWGSDYFGDTKTLDVHVKRLRAKVEKDPANPVFIQTIRGLGYKFED